MPIRTSKTEHEYPYGRHRQVGEEFDVDEADVQVLLLLGRIEPQAGEQGYVPGSKPEVPAQDTYATRDMTAARAAATGRAGRNRRAA